MVHGRLIVVFGKRVLASISGDLVHNKAFLSITHSLIEQALRPIVSTKHTYSIVLYSTVTGPLA